jgi:SAM-dependent methyltransferase
MLLSEMHTALLSPEEIRESCRAVASLYPSIPSMIMWRGCEYAAYRRFSLPEPVLDLGCGDGRFFRFLWPQAEDVTGVEMDTGTAEAAVRSGVYRAVHVTPAHQMRFPPSAFRSVFANCSIEHMDNLDEVLRRVSQCLKPGGTFLLSVVTDKFPAWCSVPLFLERIGETARAEELRSDYLRFHHLVSALPVAEWVAALERAGSTVEQHLPILPELCSRALLIFGQIWNTTNGGGKLGEELYRYLQEFPEFSNALADLTAITYGAEKDQLTASGAVLLAFKR